MSTERVASESVGRLEIGFPGGVETLPALLQRRAHETPDLCGYRFRWEDDESSMTYGDLDRRARSIGAVLSKLVVPGQRALLVFPPGLSFVEAFFGCLYAGVLAVPATHPRPRRPMTRIATVAEDCQAAVLLTTRRTMDTVDLGRLPPTLQKLNWVAVDEVANSDSMGWTPPEVDPESIAFLQYTSGSTSDPKGVIITHANLTYNLEMIRVAFGMEKPFGKQLAGTGVSWLPPHHDMGLIGGILEALYARACSILMSPSSFLRRPERWLQTISKYRASVSGAPNFAFDLCARKTSQAFREQLDLSCWRVAFCGAEPVRAETMQRFVDVFGPCGFREEAFYPCYGLAESTLIATGGNWKQRPRVIRVRRSHLLSENLAKPSGDEHDTQTLVSCGKSILDEEVAIIEPNTGEICREGQVGEICVQGANVSPGYWDSCDKDDVRIACDGGRTEDGLFLRTGDLGFQLDGHMYVTGRLKDLLVIRGRNHYPHDIETTAHQAHECLLPGGGAAFALDASQQSELVIVHEVDRAYRNVDKDEVFPAIRRQVIEEHEIDPQAIVLIRQGSLPRTTSGKVQRYRCAAEFQENRLKALAQWTRPTVDAEATAEDRRTSPATCFPPSLLVSAARSRTITSRQRVELAEQIESNLLQWLGERGSLSEHELDRDRPFAEFGIDSLAAVELSGELEAWSGVEITEDVAWRYSTPAAMAHYLAGQIAEPGGETDQADNATVDALAESDFAKLLAEVEQMTEEEASALANDVERGPETSE